jgi:uncharacterized metal-binding protein YceD (DUF177 family)
MFSKQFALKCSVSNVGLAITLRDNDFKISIQRQIINAALLAYPVAILHPTSTIL